MQQQPCSDPALRANVTANAQLAGMSAALTGLNGILLAITLVLVLIIFLRLRRHSKLTEGGAAAHRDV